MTKTWSKQDIVKLLENNDKAIGRALMRLKENQTSDEQTSLSTRYKNGLGFRPCHARMGVEMASYFERNGRLTEKQASYWRVKDAKGSMRIGIYAGQLLKKVV